MRVEKTFCAQKSLEGFFDIFRKNGSVLWLLAFHALSAIACGRFDHERVSELRYNNQRMMTWHGCTWCDT